MTTDERIEKLAEGIEGINQTLDMFIRISIDNQRNWEERFAKTEERLAKAEERSAKLDERMAQLMENMNRLNNIVIRHEERLDDLDDRLH